VELILRATVEYNRSLHSVTECRPVEAFHVSSDEGKMATNLDRVNPSRQDRVFAVGKKFTCVITRN